jgi:hypothetical protein
MRMHYGGRILIQASLKVEPEEARKLKLNPDELSRGNRRIGPDRRLRRKV